MSLRASLGLLRDHDYRQLFNSTLVSQFGFQITLLAIPLVAIVSLEATAFQVGLLSALQTIAFLLVGLPAGVWVDRLPRRPVMIVADLARAALLLTVPLAWWAEVLTMWHLCVVGFLQGVFTVMFDVAYQSVLPQLVGRDNLVEGNAKLESVRQTAQLGGPAVAGQLVRLMSAPVTLLLNSVALAVSAVFLLRVRTEEKAPDRRAAPHLFREIGEGLRFVAGNALLRAIALCTGTANLFMAAFLAMLILFLERTLGLGPGMIGLVLSVSGIGGLLGVFVARRFADRVGQGPAIWMSAAATSTILLMPLVAAPGWRLWVGVAGYTAVSVGQVTYNVTQVSLRQAITPDHLLGRMNATMRFMAWGTLPLGALLGGALGTWFETRTALTVAAVGVSLTFLPVLLSPLRTMRTLPADGEEQPA